ncbi:MAG: hypothetical protein AB8G05_07915 [Oligoflexales bacterium]
MKFNGVLLNLLILMVCQTSYANSFHWSEYIEDHWDKPRHECIIKSSRFNKETWYYSWNQERQKSAESAMDICLSESKRPKTCKPLTCLQVRSHRWIQFHLENVSGRNIFSWVIQNWNRGEFECNSEAGFYDSWFFGFGLSLDKAQENSLDHCERNASKPRKCSLGSCYEVKSDEWIELHSTDAALTRQ